MTNEKFETWMKETDDTLIAQMGISVHDSLDVRFRDWFEQGMSPGKAAYKYIKPLIDNLGVE
jgi:hypothetical protein